MSTRTRDYFDYIVAAQHLAEKLRSRGENLKRAIGAKMSEKNRVGNKGKGKSGRS